VLVIEYYIQVLCSITDFNLMRALNLLSYSSRSSHQKTVTVDLFTPIQSTEHFLSKGSVFNQFKSYVDLKLSHTVDKCWPQNFLFKAFFIK
jgi:hypothetical protein